MKAEGLTLYLKEAHKHCIQNLAELDELRDDLVSGNFRSRDYRAVERVLQVYTELCIGLAKHWLKSINKESASDAYRTFSLLRENSQISADELADWRKILGMRNGLVHDYLNIDLAIVESVIREKHYGQLNLFCLKAIDFLSKS
jgi:uncharacterized protein YutE (UPF0331/DUF86 family)